MILTVRKNECIHYILLNNNISMIKNILSFLIYIGRWRAVLKSFSKIKKIKSNYSLASSKLSRKRYIYANNNAEIKVCHELNINKLAKYLNMIKHVNHFK
jgi:hypothetical protein